MENENIKLEENNEVIEQTEQTENTESGECRCQPRYKSWALWLSVLGAVGVILNATGVLEKAGLDSTTWDVIINAVGSILIGFGIVNNPTVCGKL